VSEQEAFERQLLAELPMLQRRARILRRCPQGAEDLVQDTVEKSLGNRHRFRAGSDLRRWLLVIMHNLHVDACRRFRAREALVQQLAHLTPAEPDEVAPPTSWETVAPTDVPSLMDRLEPRLRQTMQVVLIERRSYREAAARLRVSIGTVGARIFRARARLRSLARARPSARAAAASAE
jgi:RNA polymerase sigma factor (sigma-70 family)